MKKSVNIDSNDFMRAQSLNYSKYNFDHKGTQNVSFANKNGKSIHNDLWKRDDQKL